MKLMNQKFRIVTNTKDDDDDDDDKLTIVRERDTIIA